MIVRRCIHLVKVVAPLDFSYFAPEIVEGVCIERHGRSILVPSLRLSIEHVHPSIARRCASSSVAVAIEAIFASSAQDPCTSSFAENVGSSKRRECALRAHS